CRRRKAVDALLNLEPVDQRAAIGADVGVVFHVAPGIGHGVGIEIGELIVESRAPIPRERDLSAATDAPSEKRAVARAASRAAYRKIDIRPGSSAGDEQHTLRPHV